ncbi:MAG: RDD family protein [Bacilli bacterium]|nr:RDD family protein [Bacilli bacterium]
MEENKPQTIKVTYPKAKVYKRVLSFLVDAFFFIFVSAMMFGLIHSAMPSFPPYAEALSRREQIQEKSLLYVDGVDLVTYVEASGDLYVSTAQRKDFLRDRIEKYYALTEYCPSAAAEEYFTRKSLAKNNAGSLLFSLEDGKLVEGSSSPKEYYDFYVGEYRNYSLSYLSQTGEYIATTQKIFLFSFAEMALIGTANFAFFYVVVPVCLFRKGRQTFGRAIFRIGLLTRKAISPSRGKYLLRGLVAYVLLFVLDFFAFMIPLLVSATMLLLSDKGQSLLDYMFGHYAVDVSDQEAYEDPTEYRDSVDAHGRSLLEDKDFQIEQNHI